MDEAGVHETSVDADAAPPARDVRADHDALVRARSAELARLAYLVTGDRERAVDIAATALVGLRDEWSEVTDRGTPQAEARAAVVRRLLPGRRRRSTPDSPPVFEPADAEGDWDAAGEHAAYGLDVDDDLDAVVLEAYAAEQVSGRVTLVLHELDHQDPVAIAMASGADVRTVERELESALDRIGRARVRAADAEDRDRPTEAVDAHLRRVLLAQSARAGLPLDLTEEVATRRGRTVRRRRLLTAGAGGLGLVVAGAVAGPTILRRPKPALSSAGSTPSGSATTPDGAGDTTLSWEAVWRWPARGSMANDPAVRDLSRQNQERVIYAERVDGITLVVTAKHDENQTDSSGRLDPSGTVVSIRTITARGTPNDQNGAFGLNGTQPFAVTTGTFGPGRLVVLARPEVTSVDVSSTVRFRPDGTASRIGWQPLRLTNGLGQVPSPALGSFGMSIRYAGQHQAAYSSDFGLGFPIHPTGVTNRAHQVEPPLMLAALTTRARDVACTLTGLPPAQVSVSVASRTTVQGKRFEIYVPTDQNADGGVVVYPPPDTEVAVLLTALPGGARLRTVAAWHPLVEASGQASVGLLEESAPYPPAHLERRPVLLQSASASPTLGFIAPGAASVRLSGLPLPTGQKATVPASSGLAVFAFNEFNDSATVITLDTKGRKIEQWPFVWAGTGNPWDLYG